MDEFIELLKHNQFAECNGEIHELANPGCSFVEDGLYQNVTVQILRCEKCGKYSIAWWKQPNTIAYSGGIAEYEQTIHADEVE